MYLDFILMYSADSVQAEYKDVNSRGYDNNN